MRTIHESANPEERLPRFAGSINFNAQHPSVGAFMSFTCGHFGTGGGIGVEIGRPATQDLVIGIKRGTRASTNSIRCLPFLRGGAPAINATHYAAEQSAAGKPPPGFELYVANEIRRHYGWATDTWVTPEFSFSLYTPFGPIPDPTCAVDGLREALLPAVIATMGVDNRHGVETLTAVFGIDFGAAGARLLNPRGAVAPDVARHGFAWRRSMGVMGMLEGAGPQRFEDLFGLQRWSIAEGVGDVNPAHDLGTCAGLAFEIPPGQTRTLVLAIGVYLEGIVTTGLEGSYYYTRHYTGLEDVLHAALDRSTELRLTAARLDTQLLTSSLSADQQFLVAHGTRGYYGSTQLLDVGGEPLYVVNEGEYCMMNTLDLSIDQAFWELKHNPWVVRNILDAFTRQYSYHDQVKTRGGSLLPGGISFTHDMGVHNNFSAPGHSSYELAHLKGCFSYMTQEQLCNWVLLAACYVASTGDNAWLGANWRTIAACADSLRARANPRTGVMAYDTARCASGQEITTYDSLDESLGQARSNSYIAVKCWASWIAIDMLATLHAAASGDQNVELHDSLAENLSRFLVASADDGTLPAVLEKDNPGFLSRILPAAEALVYPAYWLQCLRNRGAGGEVKDRLRQSLTSPFIETLRRHTLRLLVDPHRRNLFADGGIKLSSTSNNSWMSKIALFQHVARQVLRLADQDRQVERILESADAAHVRWQTDGSSFWACSDQFINGEARGSRYYPRVITAALWLEQWLATSAETKADPQTVTDETA